jgi:glutamate/tyrosine decarboxylase-like PLP-dependent enzyme
MAKEIDEKTIMLVGSAPCFPHGVIDPINEIAKIAQREGIWLHVDACVGGYIAPFARRLGHTIPEFDFAISGVRSISADLHKFGFCPKPASVVLYNNDEDFNKQIFDYDVWPNGRFSTATLVGTRPAGSVAAAWSVFHHLGVNGYLKIVKRILSMTRKYVEGIKAIDELHMWTEPDLSIINFGSQIFDIFSVAEEFSKSGWLAGLTQDPRGMHMMMSLIHEPVREEFLQTLKDAIVTVNKFRTKSSIKAEY